MLSLTGLITLLALIPLVWIILYVLKTGLPALNLEFFTQMPAALGQTGGGVRNAIAGTIVVTLLAMLFSIPLGILAAFYTARNPNTPLGIAVRFGTDVLSGVPSIIVGLFGYALLVKPMGAYSALAGGVAISIIMLPTIIRTTEEMLKLVPGHLREAGLGLVRAMALDGGRQASLAVEGGGVSYRSYAASGGSVSAGEVLRATTTLPAVVAVRAGAALN